MGQAPRFRPATVMTRSDRLNSVADPTSSAASLPPSAAASGGSAWPPESLELAIALHRSLQLGDRHWHALKHQKGRRGAELIAAALVQLLHDPRGTTSGDPGRRADALALLEQGQAWLRGELKDPGCPTHGR